MEGFCRHGFVRPAGQFAAKAAVIARSKGAEPGGDPEDGPDPVAIASDYVPWGKLLSVITTDLIPGEV